MRIMPSSYGSNCEDSCVVSCPSGWEREGDHCYFWSEEEKNWFEAEEACQRHGGHLASITNQDDDNYIKGKQIRAWIGGTDINKEGTWLWTDCSDWSFNSGWRSGEPNNKNGGATEDCAASYGSDGWNDNSCIAKHRYVDQVTKARQ